MPLEEIDFDMVELITRRNKQKKLHSLFNLVSNDHTFDWSFSEGLPCAKIFDGKNIEHKSVVWVNTKTGILNRHLLDDEGSIYANHDTHTIANETITVPLPITIEWDD